MLPLNDNNFFSSSFSSSRFSYGTITCRVNQVITASLPLPDPIPSELSPYIKLENTIYFEVDHIKCDATVIQGKLTDRSIELIYSKPPPVETELVLSKLSDFD